MTQDMSKDNKKQHSSQCEVRNRRTVSPSAANSLFHSRELRLCFKVSHSLLASFFRYAAVVLLMMVVGVSGVKADDYSGIYYIANNNSDNYIGYNNADNFYLCPSTEYFNTSGINVDNGKPFLTTKKTGHAANALWIVEKVEDTEYYTFKQKDGDSYKYITVNDKFSNYASNRRRVHLETLLSTELTDRNYFTIKYIHSKLGINGYSIGCVDITKMEIINT